MELVVAVFILAGLALGSGLVWAAGRRGNGEMPPDWIDAFSVERYRPMLRLLNEEELHFLGGQPGFTREMAALYRQQRKQIFRGYLRSLASDFRRLTATVRFLMLQAGADRTDLAAVLLRSQLTFAAGMLLARLRLTLYSWGIGTVNVSGLLHQFDCMRLELCARVPAEMVSAA